MLKVLGALLLLVGAVFLGVTAVKGLRDRVELLDGLRDSLSWLDGELSFSLSATPVLLERLSRSQKEPLASFYAHVSEGLRTDPEGGLRQWWQSAAERDLQLLKAEERQVLCALGETLGQYDGELQRQNIRHTVERLEQFCRRAEEERTRLGRLYGALSVAGGLLAVIVLM